MLRGIDGTADHFLADLGRTQGLVERAQRQVSSGLKIERPDAPDEIVSLVQLRGNRAERAERIRAIGFGSARRHP